MASSGRAWDAANHPTTHRAATTQHGLAPRVHGARLRSLFQLEGRKRRVWVEEMEEGRREKTQWEAGTPQRDWCVCFVCVCVCGGGGGLSEKEHILLLGNVLSLMYVMFVIRETSVLTKDRQRTNLPLTKFYFVRWDWKTVPQTSLQL